MSTVSGGSRTHKIEVGKPYVHKARIDRIHVSKGHRVIVYEGPSLGTKQGAPPFLAGEYPQAWRNAPHKARAMKDDRPKLIGVEATSIEPRELLELIWWHDGQKTKQRLEPGEWDARGDRDFLNDTLLAVKVPPNATVNLYDNSGFGGNNIELIEPGYHDLEAFGLRRRVSSIAFALDAWEVVGLELGKVLEKKERGEPIVTSAKARGYPGTSVEVSVDLGESEQESTNWHLSQSITASVEIEDKISGFKVGLSSTTEAGGGGDKGSGESASTGTHVTAPLPPAPDGAPGAQVRAVIDVIARRYRVKQEIVRQLRNKRDPKLTASQSGMVHAKRFEFETNARLV